MKLSLRKRALVALGLAVSFVAMSASPALADYSPNNSLRAGQRPRAGAETWIPQSVDFKSGWDSVNRNVWFTIGFDWYAGNVRHMEGTVGSEQFFEIDAEVPCSWARVVDAGGNLSTAGKEGYGYWFDTNVPTTAWPFNDSTYTEPCRTGNTGRGKFGIGVLHPSALTIGQHYYISVSLSTAGWVAAPSNGPVSLSVGGGTVFDSTNSLPTELSGDCYFSDAGDGFYWKDNNINGLNLRLGASWCAWQDWNHIVTRDDDGVLYTGNGTSQLVWTNKLLNQGMEEGGSTPSGYSLWAPNGGSMTRYCNDWTGAYDGNCFAQFNGGGAASLNMYQYQSLSTPVGYHPTAEAAVRCRKGGWNTGQLCSVTLIAWGDGISAKENINVVYNVPNDAHWYICRVDNDHHSGATGGFAGAHNAIGFDIANNAGSGANVDVDFTFFGGKTLRNDPSPYGLPTDVGDIPAGDACTQR